ncbi:hypothetical protein [Streptomyces albidoflavus]|uniref:hypothetical protein n=1 Tax=Streptomyces albidoflavus TaxID=1886 RepID=UPI0010223FDE|nr:hypothetical protein [Streptomyces albidoflavus]RZF02845.1 hypothetical protein C0R05_32030 [Streptomyces albidoflavus]
MSFTRATAVGAMAATAMAMGAGFAAAAEGNSSISRHERARSVQGQSFAAPVVIQQSSPGAVGGILGGDRAEKLGDPDEVPTFPIPRAASALLGGLPLIGS